MFFLLITNSQKAQISFSDYNFAGGILCVVLQTEKPDVRKALLLFFREGVLLHFYLLINETSAQNHSSPVIAYAGLSWSGCALRLFKEYLCAAILQWNECRGSILGHGTDFDLARNGARECLKRLIYHF